MNSHVTKCCVYKAKMRPFPPFAINSSKNETHFIPASQPATGSRMRGSCGNNVEIIGRAHYFHIISTLFPYYFHITSTLFPYYFHIISILFPHYFLILDPVAGWLAGMKRASLLLLFTSNCEKGLIFALYTQHLVTWEFIFATIY